MLCPDCVVVPLLLQPMSEDYPASSDGGSDGGGFDGLMDDNDEKELMIECGQRQVHSTAVLVQTLYIYAAAAACIK